MQTAATLPTIHTFKHLKVICSRTQQANLPA